MSYLGSLEPGRFVEETVASFTEADKITVVVAGDGTLKPMVSKTALRNPAVKFIGTVDTDEALRITFASDLVVAMMDPSNPNNVVGTPGKIINAMAVGRPMVTTKGLDIARKVEEAGCGITIPYDRAAFIEAVLKGASDPKSLTGMGQNGRRYYDQNYSRNRSRAELLSVYQALSRPN